MGGYKNGARQDIAFMYSSMSVCEAEMATQVGALLRQVRRQAFD